MFGSLSTLWAKLFELQLVRCVGFVFFADVILAFASRTDKSDELAGSFFGHLD